MLLSAISTSINTEPSLAQKLGKSESFFLHSLADSSADVRFFSARQGKTRGAGVKARRGRGAAGARGKSRRRRADGGTKSRPRPRGPPRRAPRSEGRRGGKGGAARPPADKGRTGGYATR